MEEKSDEFGRMPHEARGLGASARGRRKREEGNCSWVGGRLVQTLVPLHAVEERSMGTFFSPD